MHYWDSNYCLAIAAEGYFPTTRHRDWRGSSQVIRSRRVACPTVGHPEFAVHPRRTGRVGAHGARTRPTERRPFREGSRSISRPQCNPGRKAGTTHCHQNGEQPRFHPEDRDRRMPDRQTGQQEPFRARGRQMTTSASPSPTPTQHSAAARAVDLRKVYGSGDTHLRPVLSPFVRFV